MIRAILINIVTYFLLSTACLDIDECKNNTSGCDHYCNNEIGSYNCECKKGYTLADDSHTCDGKL